MKCQDVEIPSHHYFRMRGTSLITMITLHQYVTPGSIKPLSTIIVIIVILIGMRKIENLRNESWHLFVVIVNYCIKLYGR